MKINYFFGSDARSIPAYEILIESNRLLYNLPSSEIKVVTLNNPNLVRGKIVNNTFEQYCIDNDITYTHFNGSNIYKDIEYALVCSFGHIFTKEFLDNNELMNQKGNNRKKLFNLHLSILPDLKGPAPIEYAILNSYTETGITIFEINTEIDSGLIFKSLKFPITNNDYASDLYAKSFKKFRMLMFNLKDYEDTFINELYLDCYPKTISIKKSYKLQDCDLKLNDLSKEHASKRIRALNYIGPAKYEYEGIDIKVHSYSLKEGLKLEFYDGFIYADKITPPGKNKMNALDWLRGRK